MDADSERPPTTAARGDCRAAAEALARFYETLGPASLSRLGEHYAPEARFKDPFNDVTGLDAIRRVFAHMFETVDAPRFVVTGLFVQGDEAMLRWDFLLRLRGRPLTIPGATHLRFDTSGRATLHRDYWDAAGELYEQVPGLGAAMRWLRRRLATR